MGAYKTEEQKDAVRDEAWTFLGDTVLPRSTCFALLLSTLAVPNNLQCVRPEY